MQTNIFEIILTVDEITDVTTVFEEQDVFWTNYDFKSFYYDPTLMYEVPVPAWTHYNFSPLYVTDFTGVNAYLDFSSSYQYLEEQPAWFAVNFWSDVEPSNTTLEQQATQAISEYIRFDGWKSYMYSIPNGGTKQGTGLVTMPNSQTDLWQIHENMAYNWTAVASYPHVTTANFNYTSGQGKYGMPGVRYFRIQGTQAWGFITGWFQHEDNFSEYMTGITWTPTGNPSSLEIHNNNYPSFTSTFFAATTQGDYPHWAAHPKWNEIAGWRAYNFYQSFLGINDFQVDQRRFYLVGDTSVGFDNDLIDADGKSWHYSNVDSCINWMNHQNPNAQNNDSNFYFWDDVVTDDARTGESLIGVGSFNDNNFPSAYRYNPTIVEIAGGSGGESALFPTVSSTQQGEPEMEWATITLGLNFYKFSENGANWSPTELSPNTLEGTTNMSQDTFTNTYAGQTSIGYSEFEPLPNVTFNGEANVTMSSAVMGVYSEQGSGLQYLQIANHPFMEMSNRMVVRMKIDVLFGVQYHMFIRFRNNTNGVGGKIYFTQHNGLGSGGGSVDWQEAISDRGVQYKSFNGQEYSDEKVQFDFIAENYLHSHGDGWIYIVWDAGASLCSISDLTIKENALAWRQSVQMYHTSQMVQDGTQNSAFVRHGNTNEGSIGRLSNHPFVITTRRLRSGSIKEWWWQSSTNNTVPGSSPAFGGYFHTSTHTDYGQDNDINQSFQPGQDYYHCGTTKWGRMNYNPSQYTGVEDEYTKFLYPHEFQPKDAKGFYLNQHKNFTTQIGISSGNLYLFAENLGAPTYSTKDYKHIFCQQSGAIQMDDYNNPNGNYGYHLLQPCVEEKGIDSSSHFKLGYIKFHTCEYSHVTKALDGSDKVRIFYDPTRTETAKPKIIRELPAEAGQEGLVQISIVISTLDYSSTEAQTAGLKDELLIRGLDESGNNIVWQQNASAAQTYNLEVNLAETHFIEITPRGNTIYGCVAEVDSVGFLTNQPTVEVRMEQTQSPATTIGNQMDCHVYATGNAVIDNTWTVTNSAGVTTSAALPRLEVALDLALTTEDIQTLMGAQSVQISVDVVSIHADTTIHITHWLTGSEQTYDITSEGLDETDLTVSSSLYGLGGIYIKFSHDNSATTMDCAIKSVHLTAKNPTTYTHSDPKEYALDLFKDTEPFALNLNSKNYEVLDSLNGDYTKTVEVPATTNNLKAFGNQDEIEASFDLQFFQGINASAYTDGLEVFKGTVFLDSIKYDEYGKKTLELLFKGGNNNWAQLLDTTNSHFRNLFASNYYTGVQFALATSEGISAANNQVNSPIVIPVLDIGMWNDCNDGEWDVDEEKLSITIEHLRPSYKIHMVMDKVFESIGWTFKSEILKQNSEFSSFGNDFQNQYRQLIGTPAKPKVHEDEISKSLILLSTSNTHKTRSHPVYGDNPSQKLIRLPVGQSTAEGNVDMVTWVTQRALTFETEYRDDGNQHSIENVQADQVQYWGSAGGEFYDGQDEGEPSGYEVNFFNDLTQGGGSIAPKSQIRVNKSGYYRVTVNATVNMYMNAQGEGAAYWWSPERRVSIGLCPTWGNVDSTFTPEGMGLLFLRTQSTLMDENQNNHQVIEADDTMFIPSLGNTFEVAMNRKVNLSYDCFLKENHTYWIFYFDAPIGFQQTYTQGGQSHGFSEVTGCEIEIKLSEDIAPVFNWGLIYPGVGTTYEARPRVKMEHILPDVKPIEFVSEISKLYNLVWQSNPHTKVAECEPFNSFYDWSGKTFGYYEWDDKALITMSQKDTLLTSNMAYNYVDDSSDYTLQKGMTENSVLFGDVLFQTNRNKDQDEKGIQLDIFSTCKMHWENNLAYKVNSGGWGVSRFALWMPKIYSEDTFGFLKNHMKPEINNSHEHKLLVYLGVKMLEEFKIRYNVRKHWSSGDPDNHYWVNEFAHAWPQAVSYMPGADVLPATFGKVTSNNSETTGGFFNRFHQAQLEMFKTRDEVVTALVHLTPSDIAQINYRRLVVIKNCRYIISRIKDYNPSNSEPTEVELVLVSDRGLKEKLTH